MLITGERQSDRNIKLAAELGAAYSEQPDTNQRILRAMFTAPPGSGITTVVWDASYGSQPPEQCVAKDADPGVVTSYGCEIFDDLEIQDVVLGQSSPAIEAKRAWVPSGGGSVGVCVITDRNFDKRGREVECALAF